jgi:hypothetical protein
MVQVLQRAAFTAGQCPTEPDLEWFVGLTDTSSDDATRIGSHIDTCARCNDRVRALRTDASLLAECRVLLETVREAAPLPIGGNALGHFLLEEELGAGGQGVVWRALDRRTGRRVAIKVLRLGQFAPARQRRRLEREIEIVARLSHPGIVTLFETLDLPSGGKAISMELVEGTGFDRWAERVRATAADAERARRELLERLAEVADAVHHAHLRGVIHRDLKPSNILVGADGRPRIVDFGIASAASSDDASSLTTEAIGSPGYMAPEQVLRPTEPPDARGDVYALGAIAYEVLTGTRAFPERRSIAEFARDAEAARVPSVAAALPGAPRRRDLDAVIARALDPDPARRYDSALAFAEDLRALAVGAPVLARRDAISFHIRSVLRTHRRSLIVAGALAAAILLAGTAYLVTAARAEVRQRELVAWGTSISSMLAEATLDFPDGSIGKPAALRLDEARVAEAAERLDALLAQGRLTEDEQVTLSLALARVAYIAGSRLETAERVAARALVTLEARTTDWSAEAIWQTGELLAAIRLRISDGRDGPSQLASIAAGLVADPRTGPALRERMRERLSHMPTLRAIEEAAGSLEDIERMIRDAEGTKPPATPTKAE